MKYKFQSTQRLTEKHQFDRVFAEKQKTSTKYFTVYYCRNELTYPRLGHGVAKKNIKKATKRNLLKRIIREEFRLNQHKLGNFDFLFFVNGRAEKATKEEIKICIKKQIEKLL